MRKYLLFIAFLALSVTISSQSVKKGLVVDMSFDGNTLDKTKYKNHGIPDGVASVQDRFGNENSAYEFGVGQKIIIPHSRSIDLKKEFSVSVWIKMSRYKHRGMRIVDKNTAGGIDGMLIDTYTNNGTGLRMAICNFHGTYFEQPVPVNEWIHLVAIYGKGKFQYYINGKLEKSSKAPKNYLPQNKLPLILGASQGEYAGNDFFEGRMDDFRLYNRFLSEKEVKMIYDEQSVNPVER